MFGWGSGSKKDKDDGKGSQQEEVMAELMQKCADYELEVSSLKQRIMKMDAAMEDRDETIQQLKTSLGVATSLNTRGSNAQLEEAREQVKVLQREVASISEEKGHQKAREKELSDRVSALLQDLKDAHEERDTIRQNLDATLRSQEGAEAELAALRKTSKDMEGQLSALQVAKAALEKGRHEATDTTERLQMEHSEVLKEKEELSDRVSALLQDLKDAHEERDTIRQSLDAALKSQEGAEAELAALRKTNKDMEGQLSALQVAKSAFEKGQHETAEAAERLQRQHSDVLKEKEALAERVHELEEESRSSVQAREELVRVRRELDEAMQQKMQLGQQLEDRDRQLTQLKGLQDVHAEETQRLTNDLIQEREARRHKEEELTAEVKSLQDADRGLRAELEVYRKQTEGQGEELQHLSQLITENARLKAQVETLSADKGALEGELQRLKAGESELQKEKDELQDKYNTRLATLQVAMATKNALEESSNEALQQKDELIKSMEDDKSAVEKECEALRQENATLKSDLSEAESQSNELLAQLNEARWAKDEAEEKARQAEAAMKEAEATRSAAKETQEEKKRELVALRQQVDDLRQQNSSLQDTAEKSSHKAEIMRKQVESITAEKAVILSQKVALSERVDAAEHEIERLRSEHQLSMNERARQRETELQGEIEGLMKSLQESEQNRLQLQNDLDEAQQAIKDLREQLTFSQEERKTVQDERDALLEQQAVLSTQVADKQQQIEEIEHEKASQARKYESLEGEFNAKSDALGLLQSDFDRINKENGQLLQDKAGMSEQLAEIETHSRNKEEETQKLQGEVQELIQQKVALVEQLGQRSRAAPAEAESRVEDLQEKARQREAELQGQIEGLLEGMQESEKSRIALVEELDATKQSEQTLREELQTLRRKSREEEGLRTFAASTLAAEQAKELETLKQENTTLLQQQTLLSTKLNEADKERDALSSIQQDLNEVAAELEQKAIDLERDVKDKDDIIQQREAEILALRDTAAVSTQQEQRIRDLEEERASLVTANQQLQGDKEGLVQRVQALQSDLAAVRTRRIAHPDLPAADWESTADVPAARRPDTAVMETQTDTVGDEQRHIERVEGGGIVVEALQAEIEQLTEEKSSLQSELMESIRQIDELKAQETELSANLQQEHDERRAETDRWVQQFASLREEKAAMLQSLFEKCTALGDEHHRLKAWVQTEVQRTYRVLASMIASSAASLVPATGVSVALEHPVQTEDKGQETDVAPEYETPPLEEIVEKTERDVMKVLGDLTVAMDGLKTEQLIEVQGGQTATPPVTAGATTAQELDRHKHLQHLHRHLAEIFMHQIAKDRAATGPQYAVARPSHTRHSNARQLRSRLKHLRSRVESNIERAKVWIGTYESPHGAPPLPPSYVYPSSINFSSFAQPQRKDGGRIAAYTPQPRRNVPERRQSDILDEQPRSRVGFEGRSFGAAVRDARGVGRPITGVLIDPSL
ncbi:unnamed protein product [Vitrella brassicaformis CCMP3155]|uniref:Uncharacterized protein n=1 Tax=Vitrella brassicaformis (strain CCMP3155) TaxID=1169540 RepID=A0A0G4E9M6_VITBC|nr:unnamed protein product [Vitrella brassicaformis CCMP3155]|eukprot:CEL92128.1 unnamed protein product [Vitrella brassicaformis CCMP3155]